MELDQKLTFEGAAEQIEDIIKKMETGGLPLEESLKFFEKGIALINFCNEKLDSYEKKITFVMEGGDGKPMEKEADING